MKIKNLKIGTRLGIGFGIQLVLLATAIGFGLLELANTNRLLREVIEEDTVITGAATTMRSAQLHVTIATSRIVMLADEQARAQQETQLLAAREHYDAASTTMHKLITQDKAKAILARIDAGRAETRPLMDKARALGHEGKGPEGTAMLINEVNPAAERWQAALSEMVALQTANEEAIDAEAAEVYSTSRIWLAVIGLAALVMGVTIATLATRSITRPIKLALKIAQTVAAGDLSMRIRSESTDETGALIAALKTMNDSLQDIVGQVRGGTDTIACASTQIAMGNLDLSARTEEQASSLEETAASMEELNVTVKQNAENARQANVLAQSASDVAVKGGQVVAKVVETMGSINQSSRKIVDIIAVIDGIAFQTNILALNAAVEAARAGEQGRGFAVVASEVRNLAQRSASAAKEIKALIDDSVAQVAQGSTLVGNAGHTMDEIVESVRRVTDIMAEISLAGREQEMGIAQINQAVIEMDAVTQQNAALVEEAAAAAESLQDQASRLSEVVSVFKLDTAATPTPARKPLKAVKSAVKAPVRVQLAGKKVANGAMIANDEWETF
jgi:methyl-accepting chemotaxis protein